MHLWCQVTNLLGLIPCAYLVKHDQRWLAAAIFVAVVLSTVYHLDEHRELALLADVAGCILLTASIMFLVLQDPSLMLARLNVFSFFSILSAAASYLFAGEDTDSQNYAFYHSMWHFFIMTGLATFVYTYVQRTNTPDTPIAQPCISLEATKRFADRVIVAARHRLKIKRRQSKEQQQEQQQQEQKAEHSESQEDYGWSQSANKEE